MGTNLLLATVPPTWAVAATLPKQAEGASFMTNGFATTQDGVRIYYKDWGPKDA